MIYFVATPIGNLKDITLRALEVLRGVDVIFCEDTRHSIKLLNAYEIKKPLLACHKFNEAKAAEKIMQLAAEGKEIAIISDAGMPVISDPGNRVCAALKERGVPYTVVPGANAALSALVLSGMAADKFAFLGFLPDKVGERKRMLEQYRDCRLTLILHCAPQDIDKHVESMAQVFGSRRACAVREITKIHEEATFFDILDGLEGEKRGEYVLIVEGAKESESAEWSNMSEHEHIIYYMRQGFTKKQAVKLAARDRGVTKSEIYKYSLDIEEVEGEEGGQNE